MNDMDRLPWVCWQHPLAPIRYPSGTGWRSNERWECSICGRELAAEPPTDHDEPAPAVVPAGERA